MMQSHLESSLDRMKASKGVLPLQQPLQMTRAACLCTSSGQDSKWQLQAYMLQGLNSILETGRISLQRTCQSLWWAVEQRFVGTHCRALLRSSGRSTLMWQTLWARPLLRHSSCFPSMQPDALNT